MTPGGYGHKALCKPFKIIIVAWVLDTQPKLDLTAALRYFFLPQIITNRFHAGTRDNRDGHREQDLLIGCRKSGSR